MPRLPGFPGHRHRASPPPPEPLPVPPPAPTTEPRPPYRACKPCGVTWRGYEDCWNCQPSHLPQPEE